VHRVCSDIYMCIRVCIFVNLFLVFQHIFPGARRQLRVAPIPLRPGLSCATACCSVLQRVAACCSVLQCGVVCSSVFQCVPVCCSALQRVAVCRSALQRVAVCCSVLQRVAAFLN